MSARALVPLVPLTAGVLLAGCGADSSGDGRDDGKTHVTVTLTDDSCDPSPTTVPAGVVVFDVVNKGGGKINEAEVRNGDRILAEKENVVPGVPGSFTLDLTAGTYAVTCVGSRTTTPLTVTASGSKTQADSRLEQLLGTAAADYAAYVREQVGQLQTATRTLTDAVRAGDVAGARAAYPVARVAYERIEPVAESFGDLDPRIDARADDVPLDRLTGFHRLEYAIFSQGSLAGAGSVADQLDADVAKLADLVRTVTFQPAELANGASALLDEVGKTKITGEEERYSHVDLVDLTANVDGAQQAYTLLKPALETKDAKLAATIDQRFAELQTFLGQYRTGSGPADVRTYDAVSDDARRQLTRLVDALAEPLAEVAGVVVK